MGFVALMLFPFYQLNISLFISQSNALIKLNPSTVISVYCIVYFVFLQENCECPAPTQIY